MYEDPYRVSLTEDTSQPVPSYPHSAMNTPVAVNTNPYQIKMSKTAPYQDLVTQYQQETYRCFDARHHEDLGSVYKVLGPRGA